LKELKDKGDQNMIKAETVDTRRVILETLYKNKCDNKLTTRHEIGVALGMPVEEIETAGKIHPHLLDMLSQRLINRPAGAGVAGDPYQYRITGNGEMVLRFFGAI
jgi:hypothetical protein